MTRSYFSNDIGLDKEFPHLIAPILFPFNSTMIHAIDTALLFMSWIYTMHPLSVASLTERPFPQKPSYTDIPS